ncbi:MAG TPA: ABC transporter ATP-binding protein [Lacipirellulaceae bacterium]|jgi:lipoprotein-releasing system ATP-binding protein|nr:ABC transporter ATP-binding protein [Lacipirellulaceae bacterium]
MSELSTFDQWTGAMTAHRAGAPSATPVLSNTVGRLLAEPAELNRYVSASQPQTATREIVAAHYIRKSYRKASMEIPVLQGVELAIHEGEFVSVIGPSGCGKSTLLHVLATLDAPDSGEIRFEGNRIDNLPAAGRDILRNRYFGMVFQFYHLLPELTTLENVLAPAMIGQSVLGYWRRRRQFRERACEMLELVNLGHRLKHKPSELSGGEMQRTAIARALVSRPRVLFADEPTGNLDKSSGEEIMAILRRLNREQKLTIVMVTHDPRVAEQADRSVTLVDGRVVAA